MILRVLLIFSLTGLAALSSAALPALKVAADHRHLATADGKPFFLLGDTAWELFHRLTREEAELYLKNRADKGFNAILAVALAEFEFDKPNAYGELPLENNDPSKPRNAYFQHVDWVVDKAASLGLYTAILPTWGDKWNKKWGRGPEIFTPENAAIYCEWLAKRYADKPVIWILGGDRPVDNDKHKAIIRAMAAGLKKGDGGKHLISYHPSGTRNSSDYWPDEPWLDFHMFQSGHGKRDAANYDMNAKNLALPALKPTLDGEPCYEDHPVRHPTKTLIPQMWFDDYDVRKAAWRSVLSGACGHVYGTHSIWQFHDLEKRKQQTDARTPWQKAMDLPGATQMGVMKKFIEGLDWTNLRPEPGLVPGPASSNNGAGRALAAVSAGKALALIYVPTSDGVTPDFTKLPTAPGELETQAYDAATGEPMNLLTVGAGGSKEYRAVKSTRTQNGTVISPNKDWVLVIRRKQP